MCLCRQFIGRLHCLFDICTINYLLILLFSGTWISSLFEMKLWISKTKFNTNWYFTMSLVIVYKTNSALNNKIYTLYLWNLITIYCFTTEYIPKYYTPQLNMLFQVDSNSLLTLHIRLGRASLMISNNFRAFHPKL